MLFVFEAVLFLIVYLKYLKTKTVLNPVVSFGVVYLIAVPLIFVLHFFTDLYVVSYTNMLFTLSFFFLIYIADTCSVFFVSCKENVSVNNYKNSVISAQKIIFFIFLCSLICKVINFVQVLQIRGITNMKRGEFGIFANLGFFAQILTPYILLIAIEKKKILYFLLIFVELGIITMFQLKGTLLIIIVQSVFFVLLFKTKITINSLLKIGIKLLLISLIVFLLLYSVLPNLINASSTRTLDMAFQEFVHYGTCPFLCSNEFYLTPEGNVYENGMRVIFNPIIALYEAISGNRNFPDTIIHYWPMMSKTRPANVGGIFSETVYQVGYLGAFLYIFFLLFTIAFVFYVYKKQKRYLWSCAYLLSLWSLCFFGNYFASSTPFNYSCMD